MSKPPMLHRLPACTERSLRMAPKIDDDAGVAQSRRLIGAGHRLEPYACCLADPD
jgi:hypothetical protein